MPKTKRVLYFDGESFDDEKNFGKPKKGYIQCILGVGCKINDRDKILFYQGSITEGELDGEGKISIVDVLEPKIIQYWHGQIVGGEMGATIVSNLEPSAIQKISPYVLTNANKLIFATDLLKPELMDVLSVLAANGINPSKRLLVHAFKDDDESFETSIFNAQNDAKISQEISDVKRVTSNNYSAKNHA